MKVSMLKILTYPDERLLKQAEKVTVFDPDLRDLAIRMYKAMVMAKGAGLAAPQVGVLQSFFVVEKGLCRHEIIINPTWTKNKDATELLLEEGCLSFPGLFLKVNRFDKIDVGYQSIDGKMHSDTLSGFAAHVFQHESEHLNGVLFIDKMKVR